MSTSSARHRSFSLKSSAKPKDTEVEPITFDIGDESFTAKPFVQGIVLLEFLEAAADGEVKSLVAFKKFLSESLPEEDYTRLDTLLRTSEVEITLEQIAEIVEFLVEEYASRPTKASGASDANS